MWVSTSFSASSWLQPLQVAFTFPSNCSAKMLRQKPSLGCLHIWQFFTPFFTSWPAQCLQTGWPHGLKWKESMSSVRRNLCPWNNQSKAFYFSYQISQINLFWDAAYIHVFEELLRRHVWQVISGIPRARYDIAVNWDDWKRFLLQVFVTVYPLAGLLGSYGKHVRFRLEYCSLNSFIINGPLPLFAFRALFQYIKGINASV